jgi:hypothetical protein
MVRPDDRIAEISQLAADGVFARVAELPPQLRFAHLVHGLDCVAPGLAQSFLIALRERPLRAALFSVLHEHISEETARIVGALESHRIGLGLGDASPPSVVKFSETDDVVQHNEAPSPKKKRPWAEWQGHLYRGLWYPGYQTPITDLTPDDVGLASAYLAGKLTQKGCPKSDKAKKADKWNLAYQIVHGIEMVAGLVASVVMTVFYGPLGGLITSYLHKAKMAILDHFWKIKVAKDPAFQALVEKLQPTEPMTYNGFRFQLRPYGNMLVQELACKADLRTRFLMHGRMLRTLDVLAATSPTAKSMPGCYDYPSALGLLRGSIFPPRGPKFDGTPPPPKVVEQAKKVVATPQIQAIIKQPAANLTATAKLVTGTEEPTPKGVAQSAALLRARVAHHQTAQRSEAQKQKPSNHKTWLFVLGGAALGAAILATR